MDAEVNQRLVALNYICGRRDGLWGGEWTTLDDQWTKWLESVSKSLVVLWKDQNGKLIGAGVDMRVKLCPKYLEEGFHYSIACPQWHICKRFLEGDCQGGCSRSHDFYDESNRDKIERFSLEMFPNELIRRIVSYSLPQVCLLFLNGKCNYNDCPYLHICPSVVRKFVTCECALTHDNADLNFHNKEVLKRYWLRARITDFALFNILVPVEQRHFKPSVTVIRIFCPNFNLPIFEDPKGALKTSNANAFVTGNLIPRSAGGQNNAVPQRKRVINDRIPDHWSSMSSKEKYIRVKLEPSSEEFKVVELLFRNTMKNKEVIVEIERLQNPFLWEKYCRKKEYMARHSTLESANEKQLFHGTSKQSVSAICKQNFDWRVPVKNGNKYGQGVYFAKKASDSKYYAKPTEDHHHFMFLARVLVGTYTVGERSYCRPPPKDSSNPESDLYDSCVNNLQNPTVFVISDNDQCYPEYIIKYFTLESDEGILKGASAFAPSSVTWRQISAYPKVQRRPQPFAAPRKSHRNQRSLRLTFQIYI